MFTDLRYALRAMSRTPGFSAIAVLMLALAIGANAAIFGVVRAVLLRPLPFPEAERIVELGETRPGRETSSSFAHDNLWDVRDLNRSFSAVGGITWESMTRGGTAEPERVSVASVSAGFFDVLGVTAPLGRLFVTGDDEPGAERTRVVLSHLYWSSQFASDRNVLGRTIALDGSSYSIVGVLPAGTPWLDAADMFVPMIRRPGANRGSWEVPVIARLRPGATVASAQADLDAVARRIGEQHAEARDIGFSVETTEDWRATDGTRRALLVLLGAVGLLLLIACVNLANMLLARSTARSRERALRSALGASRGRVVQLAVIESLLIGISGSALGALFGWWLLGYLRTINPGEIARLAEAGIDPWVLLVALGGGLLTSLLAGLMPVVLQPTTGLATALRDGDRGVAGGRKAGRLRMSLVAVEVSLSLVLLVGAGLLLRSFGRLLDVDRGFTSADRTMVTVGFSGGRTRAEAIRAGQDLQQILDRLRASPQVISAAAIHVRPLAGSATGMGFGAADRPDATGNEIPWAGWRIISKDYFRTLGVPVLEGRDFNESDLISRADYQVIVSKRLAELLWPGESALGRSLVMWKGQESSNGRIIGVVGDMRDWSLSEGPTYSVYLPVYGTGLFPANVVAHTTLPTASFTRLVRSTTAAVTPAVPVYGIETLTEMVGESVAARRFTMMLLASLAALALVLAVSGVYGVLAYSVSQRRGEVGVRLALGASRGSVVGMVMRQGLKPVTVGLVAGVVAALVMSRFMTTLLFDMTALDAPTYLGVAGLLVAAAALACYFPAREAVRLDVLSTLRED
ncbi:MAG: ABC transporter permease [Gemmatimonadota bacterium]